MSSFQDFFSRTSKILNAFRQEVTQDRFIVNEGDDEAYITLEEINKKRFQFVQCEAGLTHSLLLNARGEVFAFGEGL